MEAGTALVALPNQSGLEFAFSGPFPQVRDDLNGIFMQFAGKPGSEALIARECVHMLVTRCVDPAQEKWQSFRDPQYPKPMISVSVDIKVTFTEVAP